MRINHSLEHLTKDLQTRIPGDRSRPFNTPKKMNQRIDGAAADESGDPSLTAPQTAKQGAAKENLLQRADDQCSCQRGSQAAAKEGGGKAGLPASSIECEGE